MKNTAERIGYIDSARGIAILLVVLGHIFARGTLLSKWLYSFHIPLFFIISGMLMGYNEKWRTMPTKQLILKKLKSIMWPYATFSLLAILYVILKSGFTEGIRCFVQTLTLIGISALWFLPVLFLAELFFIFVMRRLFVGKYAFLKAGVFWLLIAVLTSLCSIIDFRDDKSFILQLLNVVIHSLMASVFIAIGYLARKITSKDYNTIIVLIIAILALGINIILCRINSKIDFHYTMLGNPVLFYVNSILGSYSIIFLSKVLLNNCKTLAFFGRNSLVIMATHITLPVLGICRKAVNYLPINNDYINYCLIFAAVISAEIIIVLLINKFAKFLANYESFKKIISRKEIYDGTD